MLTMPARKTFFEDWPDFLARVAAPHGLEQEVRDHYDGEVDHGMPQEEAAYHALEAHDLLEFAPDPKPVIDGPVPDMTHKTVRVTWDIDVFVDDLPSITPESTDKEKVAAAIEFVNDTYFQGGMTWVFDAEYKGNKYTQDLQADDAPNIRVENAHIGDVEEGGL